LLTALLPSGVKTAKWQLTRVKRCRSKPPSFPPDRPNCHARYRRQIARNAVQPSQDAEMCVMENARQTTNNAKVHVHSTRVVSHTRVSVCTEVDAKGDKNIYTIYVHYYC